MKLWYRSLARETESTPYGAMLKRVIGKACDPGTAVHLQGVRESAGIGVHYRFLEDHETREVIYNAMRAEREGYDAFLIGNISDAGLREAREVVNIPVLGLCETSLHIKGTEVIIPAGGDIIVFLADAGIYEYQRAPILNGIVELVKMGELAVKLKRHTGRFTSKRGGYAAPSEEFLERIRQFYGPEIYPGAE